MQGCASRGEIGRRRKGAQAARRKRTSDEAGTDDIIDTERHIDPFVDDIHQPIGQSHIYRELRIARAIGAMPRLARSRRSAVAGATLNVDGARG
jgi:DNA-binding phage protein